jgi:selenocysteine lyase/cysteine desulfurase
MREVKSSGKSTSRSVVTLSDRTMSDPIYLDYNATTPVAPEVLDAMWP